MFETLASPFALPKVSRLEKLDVAIFSAAGIGLMLRSGDQVWGYVAWENTFIHCLATVLLTAITAALLTAIFFGIYYLFREFWSGWGRLLVIPWLLVARTLYPIFVARDWPATNPDPEGTAAFFALFSAALIPFALWCCLADLSARLVGRPAENHCRSRWNSGKTSG